MDNKIQYKKQLRQDSLQTLQTKIFTPLSEQYPNIIKSLNTVGQTRDKQEIDSNSSDQSESENDLSSDKNEISSSDEEDFIKKVPTQQILKNKKTLLADQNQSKYQDIREIDVDKTLNDIPLTEQHPNHYQISQDKVHNNNKSISKEAVSKRAQIRLQDLLLKRENMKKYGKQQIIRSHNFSQGFEQKFQWGQNQNREKVQEDKLRKQQIDRAEEQLIKTEQRTQRNNAHKEIKDIFPESQRKQSKFKLIWEREAKALSKGQKISSVKNADNGYFSEPERNSISVKQKKIRSQVEIDKVILMVTQNALRLQQQSELDKLKQKQIRLIKKHKVEYIDREAKAILSKIKKIPFQPPQKAFENISVITLNDNYEYDQEIASEGKNNKNKNSSKKLLKFELIEEDTFQQDQDGHIQQDRVLSKNESNKLQKRQQKNKNKIAQFKSKLSHQELKLKTLDPYSKDEQKVRREILKEKDSNQKLYNKKPRQYKEMVQYQAQPIIRNQANIDIGKLMLDEAQLPNLGNDQENNNDQQDYEFKGQVDKDIINNLNIQRNQQFHSSKAQAEQTKIKSLKRHQPNEIQLRKLYEIKNDMPPPLELRKIALRVKEVSDKKIKKVYKSQEPRELRNNSGDQTRHPIYHDLGETNMLEEDMYHAKYQGDELWNQQNRKKNQDIDSDYQEEQDYMIKSGFYKQSHPMNLSNQKSGIEQSGQYLRDKQVSFQQQNRLKSNDSSRFVEAIEQGKNDLSKLVNKQKYIVQSGKYTTDEDTDKDFIIKYNEQVWHSTDPMNKDIFTLSVKELMELPEVNL